MEESRPLRSRANRRPETSLLLAALAAGFMGSPARCPARAMAFPAGAEQRGDV